MRNPLPDWNTKQVRAIRYGVALLLLAYLLCLPRRLFDVPYATVVIDRHGELLGARIAADGQWRFPPTDTAPDKFAHCLVAFEDHYFYLHNGINPVAILRAFVQNVRAGHIVSGGSTITMQTIRLSRGERRTVGEKLIEIILASRLECRYSKREILALYAAHAPFGGNVVGVEAAAWRYFGHASAELSWAEAATLAVLPNAPSMIHLSRNREALLRKRNRLLRDLRRRGVIDDTDYELALGEALPAEPLPLPGIAPHLVADFCRTHPGERIVSTIDKGMQTQVERLMAQWHAEFLQQDIRDMAAIIVDVRTARVLVYCGNTRFDEHQPGSQVDIIRAPRSTGSILKPLLYCAALQDGDILPRTLLPDIPINVNGFAPQNFNLQFEGAVPASEVIARSLNVPSVRAPSGAMASPSFTTTSAAPDSPPSPAPPLTTASRSSSVAPKPPCGMSPRLTSIWRAAFAAFPAAPSSSRPMRRWARSRLTSSPPAASGSHFKPSRRSTARKTSTGAPSPPCRPSRGRRARATASAMPGPWV